MQLLFHFRFVGENSCIVSWNETFSSVGHVPGWSFLVLQTCGNVWKWIPKVIWSLMDWFWSFSSEFCLFVDFISARTEICMIAQVCFSFDEIKSFLWLVWGVFWSVLKVCPFFSAIDFSNVAWWALAMHCNFASYVCESSHPAFPQLMIAFPQFDKIALPENAGNFTCSSQVKRPHMQFTCVTCSLPVKTGNYTCFYAASTSRRIHAIAVNKARKLQVTSPAWCRLTYLQFAGEFTRGVIADYLQLQVILRGIAGFFCLRLCEYFFLRLQLFLPAFGGYF